MDIYDIAKDSWEISPARMRNPRHSFSAVALGGKIYVFGGSGQKFECLDECECYDPVSEEWKSISPMGTKRMGSFALVINWRILVFGGQSNLTGKDVLGTVLEYDPVGDTWNYHSKMIHPRCDFGVVYNKNQIFAFAGEQGNKYLMSTECYDPFKQKWTELRECGTPRTAFGTFLHKGRAYMMGGYAAERLSSCEHFDLSNGAWYDIPDLPTERCGSAFAMFITTWRTTVEDT
eukprot:CAMPEP_0114520920 /NCGR_PEP_ID=MMETSP0109-20121206/19891_1 /TAXON_ID=29199 /ORGANISM="Chlorarachnion reptans, Strain CCCM449" /LENGTH=232 /DNA_ID=CAMNT_0001701953 /DNA_START=848 /DNA_END=1546 /DNA_ORIENTATION=-